MKKILFIFILFINSLHAMAFGHPGSYQIDSTGWIAKSTPAGDVFICKDCPDFVQVQISYGPKSSSKSPFKNNDQFIKMFNTKEKKEKLVRMLLDGSIPVNGYKIQIVNVEDDFLYNLKAIKYSAIISIPGAGESRETSLIAMHRDQIIKFTANFYENKLSAESAIALEKLNRSLVLF